MELFSLLSAALTLTSIYLVGGKCRAGFIVGAIAALVWIAWYLCFGIGAGIALTNAVALALDIRGYRRWGRGRGHANMH